MISFFSKLFLLSSFSLFLIIIDGEKLSSVLLYALNLIDWPNLDSKILSPSYNFNLWITSGSKYSPRFESLSSVSDVAVPVWDVSEYELAFPWDSSLVSDNFCSAFNLALPMLISILGPKWPSGK